MGFLYKLTYGPCLYHYKKAIHEYLKSIVKNLKEKRHTQNCINASVVFLSRVLVSTHTHTRKKSHKHKTYRVIRDLRVLPEHNFTTSSNHPQLWHIHLDNRSLCHYTELSIHGWLRVLLNTQNRKLKRSFQIGCSFITGSKAVSKEIKEREGYIRCVTFAFLYRNAIGLMNRSSLTGLRVNPSPTNVAFVTIRFQAFDLLFPVLTTLNISSSAIPLTLGNGTAYFAALSFRFCLRAVLRAFASFWFSLSKRYVGKAPSGPDSVFCLTFRSSCALSVFLSWTFSAYRFLWRSLALIPKIFWAVAEFLCASLAIRFRLVKERSSDCWR